MQPAHPKLRPRLRLCLFVTLITPAACATTPGLRDAGFTGATPLAGNAEIARRSLSPDDALQLAAQLAHRHEQLRGAPVIAAREHFGVHVPPQPPPTRGYGLLVFVPPWREAALPHGWAPVLDRFGIVAVTASRSGNEENVLGRRMPLALLGAVNAMRQYPIDPRRVIIAGFSGGSRVALRLALGYPDLFGAAILNAGSDPIGGPRYALPPAPLLARFQRDSRIVLLTNAWDAAPAGDDLATAKSLRGHGVRHVALISPAASDHAAADPSALAQALQAATPPPS